LPVGTDGDREGVHLLVHETGVGEVELVGDGRHVDHVVRDRMHVEAVPGDRLLGARTAARSVARFEHEHVPARRSEIAGGDEAVVAGADDDDRGRHGQVGEGAAGRSAVVVGGIGRVDSGRPISSPSARCTPRHLLAPDAPVSSLLRSGADGFRPVNVHCVDMGVMLPKRRYRA
jgi:hypothetical protein